jgi:hypothetical protein
VKEAEQRLVALEATLIEIWNSIEALQKAHTVLGDQLRHMHARRGKLTSDIFRAKKALGHSFEFCVLLPPGPKKKPCKNCGECGVRAQ